MEGINPTPKDNLHCPNSHAIKRKDFNLYFCRLTLLQTNLIFAFIAVVGQVGQNISLPLWLTAAAEKKQSSKQSTTMGSMDAYFVLSFASLFFVVAFGVLIIVVKMLYPHLIGQTERRFPHKILIAVGLCDALNGALVVFASPPNRTAPYLQAILGNFMIPLTIFARFIFLRKKPTTRKLFCGMAVLLSLFICLLPSIFTKKLDPNKAKEQGEGASGTAGILWALCFMTGFAPATLMNVIEEKGLKMQTLGSNRGVNIVFFLFWESVYQLISVMALFWVDIIPGYGFADNLTQFGKNWWFGFRCFFGAAGCGSTPGIRGTVFVIMYLLSYLGGGLLLRYAEGATLLAIVTSLVTPLGFLFWTLFKPEPFEFKPEVHVSMYYSIGALVVMVPAIYFYNTGSPEVDLLEQNREEYKVSTPNEYDPLINKNSA